MLITLDSLRADVVSGLGGEAGLTPNLAALVREADWAGKAVAASSWGVPAMASLFTGLQPWQHQAILDTRARLAPDLFTLPQALKSLGYQTFGFSSGGWYTPENGYAQGFDNFEELGKGWQASEQLAGLAGGRQFVWLHLPEPQAPYVRRAWLLHHLDGGATRPVAAPPPHLPHTIEPLQLEAFYDPAARLAPADRRLFWDMYRLNVAWADERVGRLLEALRASGQWNRTLIVVTANHGEAFGEHGQLAHGGNLGRELLEVPLIVKLPAGSPPLAMARGDRVAAARLWATLVESAGGTAPPAMAPSLFRPATGEILSELYGGNGSNEFSLLDGDFQLCWEARFARPEPAYYHTRFQLLSEAPDPAAVEAPRMPIARLAEAFSRTPVFSGVSGIAGIAGFSGFSGIAGVAGGAPRLWLEQWSELGTRRVVDPVRTAAMARRLAALWERLAGEAQTPAAEERFRLPPAAAGR